MHVYYGRWDVSLRSLFWITKIILLAAGCAAKRRLSAIRGLCQIPYLEQLTSNGWSLLDMKAQLGSEGLSSSRA